MLKTRRLYLKSAKHWKGQILEYKELDFIPIRFCPFCDEYIGDCNFCRVDNEICFHPSRSGATLVHKIQNNRSNEIGLKLAKKLRRKLLRKALLW